MAPFLLKQSEQSINLLFCVSHSIDKLWMDVIKKIDILRSNRLTQGKVRSIPGNNCHKKPGMFCWVFYLEIIISLIYVNIQCWALPRGLSVISCANPLNTRELSEFVDLQSGRGIAQNRAAISRMITSSLTDIADYPIWELDLALVMEQSCHTSCICHLQPCVPPDVQLLPSILPELV